jgi:hypothetical protein
VFISAVRLRLIALSRIILEKLVWSESTKPVKEMSTRNNSLGVKVASA